MPELKLVDYGFSASDSESEEDTPFTPGDLKLQAIWKRVRPSQTDQHDIDDILATLNSIVQAVIEFHETKKPLAISFVHDRRGFRDPISDSSDDDDCQTDATSEVVEVSAGESDSDAEEMPQIVPKTPGGISKNQKVVKTSLLGELPLESLPPLENLRISVPREFYSLAIEYPGSGFVLVIIQSDFGVPAFDIDSVLFTKDRQSFGQIFEVFGPVTRPLYAVRFNSQEMIESFGIKLNDIVFCAPDVKELAHTVFTDALRKIKGTDASWENNQECPNEEIEFSDDEEERRYYAKLKHNKTIRAENSNADNKRRCPNSNALSNLFGPGRNAPNGRGRGNRGGRGRGSARGHHNAQFSHGQNPQMATATKANWSAQNPFARPAGVQADLSRPPPMQYAPNQHFWPPFPPTMGNFGSAPTFSASFPFGPRPPPPPPPF